MTLVSWPFCFCFSFYRLALLFRGGGSWYSISVWYIFLFCGQGNVASIFTYIYNTVNLPIFHLFTLEAINAINFMLKTLLSLRFIHVCDKKDQTTHPPAVFFLPPARIVLHVFLLLLLRLSTFPFAQGKKREVESDQKSREGEGPSRSLYPSSSVRERARFSVLRAQVSLAPDSNPSGACSPPAGGRSDTTNVENSSETTKAFESQQKVRRQNLYKNLRVSFLRRKGKNRTCRLFVLKLFDSACKDARSVQFSRKENRLFYSSEVPVHCAIKHCLLYVLEPRPAVGFPPLPHLVLPLLLPPTNRFLADRRGREEKEWSPAGDTNIAPPPPPPRNSQFKAVPMPILRYTGSV